MNSFGNIYRLTSFGESHGPAIGGVIDGMPAGVKIDFAALERAMARRRPGQSAISTARREADSVEFLSGVLEGVSTGAPIGFIIRNTDTHPEHYDEMRMAFRPSHADYTYERKYGLRDHRGGGRSSARETAVRVVAGELARQVLERRGITVYAYTSQVGEIAVTLPYTGYRREDIDRNDVRCPDAATAEKMRELIASVKSEGDTIGGIITGVITGLPAGIGEPTFGKLQSALAGAMLTIGAAKGFDYGMGFEECGKRGSEMIDEMVCDENGKIRTTSNHSGGIQGGISNGEDVYFRVAFKPVATLLREVNTVTPEGENTTLKARGRHDACVLPRAVPVVEAMASMVVLDYLLLDRTTRL